jgi:hypothetical protein
VEELHDQLSLTAEEFLGNSVDVKDIVYLPKILDWYQKDCVPSTKDLLQWLMPLFPKKTREVPEMLRIIRFNFNITNFI